MRADAALLARTICNMSSIINIHIDIFQMVTI